MRVCEKRIVQIVPVQIDVCKQHKQRQKMYKLLMAHFIDTLLITTS